MLECCFRMPRQQPPESSSSSLVSRTSQVSTSRMAWIHTTCQPNRTMHRRRLVIRKSNSTCRSLSDLAVMPSRLRLVRPVRPVRLVRHAMHATGRTTLPSGSATLQFNTSAANQDVTSAARLVQLTQPANLAKPVQLVQLVVT